MRIAWIMLFSVSRAGSGGRGRDWLQQRSRVRFKRQQPALGGKSLTTGIDAEMRGGDNAVAWDDDRDRIAAIGLADRSGTAACRARNVDIRSGRAIGDIAQ